jgi:hypothetical protein
MVKGGVDTDQLIRTAQAQALKAGIGINTAVLADTIRGGLPDNVVFDSPEGLGVVRKTGELIAFVRDGKIVRQATLLQVGADRLLVNYAISRAYLGTGSF